MCVSTTNGSVFTLCTCVAIMAKNERFVWDSANRWSVTDRPGLRRRDAAPSKHQTDNQPRAGCVGMRVTLTKCTLKRNRRACQARCTHDPKKSGPGIQNKGAEERRDLCPRNKYNSSGPTMRTGCLKLRSVRSANCSRPYHTETLRPGLRSARPAERWTDGSTHKRLEAGGEPRSASPTRPSTPLRPRSGGIDRPIVTKNI